MSYDHTYDGINKTIGTLVPLFSLWSEKTNSPRGTIEDGMYFLDWLIATGQHAWQLLPLHETPLVPGTTQYVASPYKSYGSGLDPRYLPPSFVDLMPTDEVFASFNQTNKYWLDDYALFCSLRDHFHTDDWTKWEDTISHRDPQTLAEWTAKLQSSIYTYRLQQWRLHAAYDQLKKKAKEHAILLIGDAPYYLALKSPLVWQYQRAFLINPDGSLPKISGIVYEPKAMYGRQVWGHPIYDWDNATDVVLALWHTRIRYMAQIFDTVRLDHTNGFFSYGELDPHDSKKDRRRKGPGRTVLEKIIHYADEQHLSIFAEDQGLHLHDLRMSLQELGIPGIRVALYIVYPNPVPNTLDDPSTKNTFVYTSTHDNETLYSRIQHLRKPKKELLCRAFSIPYTGNPQKLALAVRSAVLHAQPHTVIIPIQDWLLTTERINLPGTEREIDDPNWRYRIAMPIEKLPTKLLGMESL